MKHLARVGTLLLLGILLADVAMGLAFLAQLRGHERAISRQWTQYAYPAQVPYNQSYLRAFTMDARGRVWVSTPPDGGLNMLNPDGTWTTFTTQNSSLLSDTILALDSDETGRIGVMTSTGVGTFGPDGTWTSFLEENLPPLFTTPHIEPYSLVFGKEGEIWITAERFTLQYRLPGDGTWVAYDKQNPSGSLQAVDRQGAAWLGGDYHGIFKQWSNGRLTRLPPIPGKTETYSTQAIRDAAFDQQGRLWVAAGKDGLFVFDPGGTWTSYTDLLHNPRFYPDSLRYHFGPLDERLLQAQHVAIDRRGNVWFASDGCTIARAGVYHRCDGEYSAQNLSKLSPDGRLVTYSAAYRGLTDVNDRMLGLEIDPQGRAWIAHYGGITVFDESSPFPAESALYTELIRLAVEAFWSETIALWLGLALVLCLLFMRGAIDGAAVISFLVGFAGWFLLNSLNLYLPSFTYYLNEHVCPFYESGYPACATPFAFGLSVSIFLLNVGILFFWFKMKKPAGMWGFLLAFVMNTIMHALLGRPGPILYLHEFIMPFFLR